MKQVRRRRVKCMEVASPSDAMAGFDWRAIAGRMLFVDQTKVNKITSRDHNNDNYITNLHIMSTQVIRDTTD